MHGLLNALDKGSNPTNSSGILGFRIAADLMQHRDQDVFEQSLRVPTAVCSQLHHRRARARAEPYRISKRRRPNSKIPLDKDDRLFGHKSPA